MADAGARPPQHPRLTELATLDQGARVALVEEISAKGFEPGCWIRVDDSELIATSTARDIVLLTLANLDKLPPRSLSAVHEFEGEHPWDPPNDGQPAWIIISQSCDLIRDVRDEPLVQIALLRYAGGDDDLVSWSRNSVRWIPLDPTGKSSRYYVDLRVQAFVAKQALAGLDVRQAIPADDDTKQRPRTRFALRVGQRFSRMGIPTRVVDDIVAPLVAFVAANKSLRAKLDETFSEWLLTRNEPPALIAVTPAEPASETFRQAEDLLIQHVLSALPDELATRLDDVASQAITLAELSVPVWMDSYKIDLDFLTYGARGPAASPEPQA
jgi:hypothetical protein